MSLSERHFVGAPSVAHLAFIVILAVLGLGVTGYVGVAPGATRARPLASPLPSPTAPAADASGAPIAVDATLLDVLPASVAGVAMTASPEAAAAMISNVALQAAASAIAVGSAIAPGDSGDDDLAVATVIRLRPGIYSDAFYERWRAEYDAAACGPAGGVSSHLQQQIGLHQVEVTTCAQGARTYHTHLPGDLLVSVTAVGPGGFGDLVMAGLRQ